MLLIIETSLAPLVQMHPERSYNLLRKSFLNGIFEKGPSLTHRKISTLDVIKLSYLRLYLNNRG